MGQPECIHVYPHGTAGRGRPPFLPGASGRGFVAVFRGLVFALLRPCDRLFRSLLLRSLCFALLSALSRLRRFRLAFLASRLVLGLLAVVSVALRHFLVLPFGVGLSYVRWFRVCVLRFVCVIQRPLL